MPRFQFTLRDMFLATTLFAVGAAAIAIVIHPIAATDNMNPNRGGLLLASAAAIGAGIGAPFHAKRIGAMCGVVAFLLGAVILIVAGAVDVN